MNERGARTRRPGITPRTSCSPRTTNVPFTNTSTMPDENCVGFSNVARRGAASDQSLRDTSAGSTPAARRAGNHADIKATRSNSTQVARSVTGSVGLTSSNIPRNNRVVAIAPARPATPIAEALTSLSRQAPIPLNTARAR